MSSPTFRFVHAADLHLDVRFHGLRRASPPITHALAEAALTAWDTLVQLTIDQHAAFLLLAGDICGGAERAVAAQLRFLGGLQRLSAHGIRTFIVRGADDPAERWMGIHQWPDLVHCFGSRDVEAVAVTTAGGHLATIHGISHSADRTTNRVARFRRGSESGVQIGVLHARVGTSEATPWDHCSITDLLTGNLDYWALGHDHRHQRLSEGHPWIVYPGTLQGRSPNSDETGPKGAVVATVTDGVVSDATHHALDAVRLMKAQVDVSTLAGPSDCRRALLAAATRLRSECSGRTVIAACELLGRPQAWMRAQPADGLWDRLLEELRQEQVAGDALVWWDSVLDTTEAREIQNQKDVSVHVRKLVEALRRSPAGLDRLLSDQSVPLAGLALPVGQSAVDPIEIDDLLTSAERAAFSFLERDEP